MSLEVAPAVLVRASELRMLDVINITDGRRLGNVFDIDLDVNTGDILALLVPRGRGLFSFFQAQSDLAIPWERIVKIGVDVILVELPEEAGIDLAGSEQRRTARSLRRSAPPA